MPGISTVSTLEPPGSWDTVTRASRTPEKPGWGVGRWGQRDPGSHPDLAGQTRRGCEEGRDAGDWALAPRTNLPSEPWGPGAASLQGTCTWQPPFQEQTGSGLHRLSEGCPPVETVRRGKDRGGGTDGVLPGCSAALCTAGIAPHRQELPRNSIQLVKIHEPGAVGCTPSRPEALSLHQVWVPRD